MRASQAFVLVWVVACAPHSGVYVGPPLARLPAAPAIFAYTAHPESDAAVAREYAAIDEALIDSYDFATGHHDHRTATIAQMDRGPLAP